MKILKWFFSKKNIEIKEIESQKNNDFKKINIESKKEHELICPNCKNTLRKFPLRKTKCPYCKKNIFIRKLEDSKEKTLVTEKQAQEIDLEREKEYLKYKGFHNLESYGVTKDEFLKRKEEHYLKFGIENNNDDVVWSFFNELLIKNANDVNKLRMIYYTMAMLLHQEGKDNFELLQLSAKATLDNLQLRNQSSDLVFNFEIMGCRDSCENCKKMNGKIISKEEAYLLPVPCRECTHSIGFCRCTYILVPIRDSDGVLILKS